MKPTRIVNKELLESYHYLKCAVYKCEKAGHAHHLRSRKSGGDDIESNLLCLCLDHHTEIHKIGLTTFANKRPEIKEILEKKSWFLSNSGHWKSKYK